MSALALLGCSSATPPQPSAPAPSSAEVAPTGDASAPDATSAPKTDPSGRSFSDCPSVGAAVAPAGPASEGQARHDELTRILQGNRDKFRCCYDVARASRPELKGDYLLEIVLKPDGSIKSVAQREESSMFKDEAMTQCMIQVANILAFPPSTEKKETTIPYRFGFTPSGGR